jgi:hypothetical protein
LDDMAEIMVEIDPLNGIDIPGMPFANRLGVDMGLFHGGGAAGGLGHQLNDPLFMRPPNPPGGLMRGVHGEPHNHHYYQMLYPQNNDRLGAPL